MLITQSINAPFNEIRDIRHYSMKTNQVTTDAVVAQINHAYEQFCNCGAQSKGLQIEGANHARQAGMLLEQFKKDCGHGNFQRSFASFEGKPITGNRFNMSYEHGNLLIRIANRYPDTFTKDNFPDRIRSLHDLMYASHQLIEPSGHGEQNRTTNENALMTISRQLMAFTVTWDKYQKSHPVSSWSGDGAAKFVAEYEPIVEKANHILAAAKERALHATDKAA